MSCYKATYGSGVRPDTIGALTALKGERFPIGVAPIMAMQLSTARKLTLKVRMFLQKYGILLLERTRTRYEGDIREPKTASTEGFKTARPFVGG